MMRNTKKTRRTFLRSAAATAGITTGSKYTVKPGIAQGDRILQAQNNQLTVELENIDSKKYISSLRFNGQNTFATNKGIHPSWNILRYSETIGSTRVAGDGWQGYRTDRRYEYDGPRETADQSTLRITQTTSLPPNQPLVITELEITNESESTTTVERPDSHINDGWVVSRLPPLRDPTGSYRYYIQGTETRIFEDRGLWESTNLTTEQRFITYFGDELAITTSYLDGPSTPTNAVTVTSENIENRSDLPQSEDNPPARQTPGFSVDAVDFCVEGFSIEPEDTVSFTIASMVHAGGANAVARAEELTQRAESVSSGQPQLREGSSGSTLTTVFRQAGDQTDNPLFLGAVGTGILGVGYGAYRKLRSDDKAHENGTKMDSETNIETTVTDTDEADFSINSYSDIDFGDIIEITDNMQIQNGSVDDRSVWVVTPPETTGQTIAADSGSDFVDQIRPWVKMDQKPTLVSVYGAGVNPLAWAAVEPADHSTLSETIHTANVAGVVDTLQQVCDALHHVHRYGNIYENLTTESMLYTDDDQVKLRGILDQFEDSDPWYNAPEEFDSESSEQAVVYRIGIIGYELLTGTLPYGEYPNGDPETRICHSEPIPPSEQRSEIGDAVDRVFLKALASEPTERYETVLHLRDEFRNVTEQL